MLEVLAAVAGDEPDVSEHLLRDTDFDTEFATLRQARAIITTARRQGLDSVKLAKLAAAMGHESEALGVTLPSTDHTTVSILLGEARAAGLPHEAIDRIYQAIDPDGYEEERYEQAVDLLEFGDAAAGALDGLPHFDGEFSSLRDSSPGADVPVTLLNEATGRRHALKEPHEPPAANRD